MTLEPATVLEWKSCSICNVGAACVLDGPVPDFEVGFISNIFGMF